MTKLKDRRAAHLVVAELIRKARSFFPELGATAGVVAEIEKIIVAHALAGAVQDELPEDHVIDEPGALASGGVYRCSKCGQETNLFVCAACIAKSQQEPISNGGLRT